MADYKINIHAHSIYSDGVNSPRKMAETAKELGFSALVLTDHWYKNQEPHVSITPDKLYPYLRAIREAQEILPVIRGMEVGYMGEEVLVFGEKAINKVIKDNGIINLTAMNYLRKYLGAAIILCHPHISWPTWLHDIDRHIDGYERHNSRQDYFKYNGKIDADLSKIEHLQAWHNSDAHNYEALQFTYNITQNKITTEEELIAYIKSGKVNKYHVDGECEMTELQQQRLNDRI